MDNENITLHQHEQHSQARAAHLGAKIDHVKEKIMGTPVNVFTPAADGGSAAMLPAAMMAGMSGGHGLGGAGAGLGAGLVGGLLGGLLFGGRGFGGWGGGWGDGIGPAGGRAAAALDGTDGMAIIGAIGNVKDTVNAGTASVTAAVTNGNAMLTNTVVSGDQALMNAIGSGFAAGTSNTLQQTIMLVQQAYQNQMQLQQELCTVNQNVSAQGCQTREAVAADGDKTRAYLAARFQLEDQTEINKLNAKVIELQNEGRTRELGTKIEIQNTAVATQLQTQQQQQQQQILTGINQLFPLLAGIQQIAHATNTNVIAGNSGAVVTGPQTANPTNVNA